MMSSGTWWVKSKSDPRWDGKGPSRWVGMFEKPPEVETHIEVKKKELGSEPPADAEWGYMKD